MARLTKLLERGGLEKTPVKIKNYIYPIEHFISYLNGMNPRPTELTRLENFALGWLSMMNRYLEHTQAGIAFAALRYQDLTQHPDAMLKAIFDYCGLPATEVAKAKQAFARDSQEGTRFSGKANRQDPTLELTDEHLEQVTKILEHHSQLNDADAILPNTLEVKQ
jgi:hypothetical protein